MFIRLLFIVLLLIPSVSALDVNIKDNILTINGEFSSVNNIYYEDDEKLVGIINFYDKCNKDIKCKGKYSYSLVNLKLDESYYFNVYDYNDKETKRFSFGFRGTTSVIGKSLYEICSLNEECASGNCVGPEYHCCPIDRECFYNNECYDVGEFTPNGKYVCTNNIEDIGEFKTCEDYCSEQGKKCESGRCVGEIFSVAKPAITESISDDPCEGEGVPCKYGWWGTCIGKLFLPVWKCEKGCVNGKCPLSELKIISKESILFPCPDYGPGIRIEWEAIEGVDHYRVEYYDDGWKHYTDRDVIKNPEIHFEKDGKTYAWVNFVQLPNTEKCVIGREDFIDPFNPKTGCSGDYNFKDILIKDEEACINLCNKISGATCCQFNKGKDGNYCYATNGNTMFFNSKDVLAVSRKNAQICNRCFEPEKVYSIRIKAQDVNNNDLTEWATFLVGLDDLKEIECKGKEYYWSKIEGNPKCYGKDKKTGKEKIVNIISFDEANKLMENYVEECGCNENDNVNYKQIPVWNMRLTVREQCLISEKCYLQDETKCDNLGCASKLALMPFSKGVVEKSVETEETEKPIINENIFLGSFIANKACCINPACSGGVIVGELWSHSEEECKKLCQSTLGATCCQMNKGNGQNYCYAREGEVKYFYNKEVFAVAR